MGGARFGVSISMIGFGSPVQAKIPGILTCVRITETANGGLKFVDMVIKT
jgi:hypothetical protein